MSTTCSACGHENRQDAKFCGACGGPLGQACPQCGTPIRGDERFCTECGTPVASATPPSAEAVPASAERKHITVLFADVAGSMDLQERLDAEVWAQIMGRFVSILAEGVRKYGGTVDKFTGDGIMALFGAPVAQEDHARRACHAAWHLTRAIGEYSEELRREQGVELHVRLGLNSGEVVVGRVGDDVTLDPTALGHTVGLAQRMEAMAEPGTAYLSEYTVRLVEGSFRLEELGRRPVKGATQALAVYALGAPLARPVRRGVGVSPLVGRERELAVLEDALDMACEGQFQVVGVVGEAGVGKSRLCEEFARSVSDRGIAVCRAAGVSHGRDVPLLPILAFQREYFGITDTDDPVTARRKVTDRLLELDPGLEDVLPLLFDFLEVQDPDRPVPPMAAEVRMRRIFDAVRRITARRSEREMLVLFFEDLHWFDRQSEAFLQRLIESYPGSRTLVMANFRPEFSAHWMRHSYYRQLPLAPLRGQAVSELLGGLLGVDLSLAPLVAFVLERTGGNPFFVEEVVRALIEDGTLTGSAGDYRLTRPLHEIRVPPSVQSVLAARIDRLPAEQKIVLETASVIGRTFDLSVLSRVVGSSTEALDQALCALCAAELLQETKLSMGEYRFWHPLTQEVAYRSLLSDRRSGLHVAVANTLVELDPARQDERAALIAGHFQAAGDHLNAARWTAQAAVWARRSDIGEALRRWKATLDHLAHVAETEETLRLGFDARTRLLLLGARLGLSREELDSLFAEGKALGERLGNAELLTALNAAYGSVQFWRGDLRNGLASYFEATRLAEPVVDRGLRAAVSTGPPFAYIFTGPVTEALALVDSAIDLSASDAGCGAEWSGYSPLARNLLTRAELLAVGGRLGESWDDAQAALTIARERTELELVVLALSVFPRLSQYGGGDSGCAERAKEAEAILDQLDNLYARVAALRGIGIAMLLSGHCGQARETFLAGLRDINEHGTCRFLEASLLTHLAQAQSACGQLAEAYSAADQAVQVADRQGAKVVAALALVTRAQVRGAVGGHGTIRARSDDLQGALALVNETGVLTYEPLVREELGRLHGDRRQLLTALALYRQIGAIQHAGRLEAELAARPGR